MEYKDIAVIGVIGVMALAIFLQRYYDQKKFKEVERKNALIWKMDYHNPVGPNYDAARVAAEEAAAEAERLKFLEEAAKV
jgi:hypothetical protein